MQQFSLGVIALIFATLSFAVFAAESPVQNETTTARTHALMAVGADSLKMSHAHLHHAINCLVGPDSAAFDADAANPCKGMGDGALADADSGSPLHARLEKALAAAQSGVAKDDLAAAHKAAKQTAQLLKKGDASQ